MDFPRPTNRFRIVVHFRRIMLILACAMLAGRAQAQDLLVSAAASLTNVLPVIAQSFQQQHPGVVVRFNFASSGTLAQQIQQGAPVDVFVSAAQTQMNALQMNGLIDTATRRNICGDELAVIAPRSSQLRDWKMLAEGSIQRIAMGDPASVPAGMYAMQTLKALGLWGRIQEKLVFGENVRQTLAYIDGGNVDAAIVYLTDAAHASHAMIVVPAPSGTHDQIIYPAAVIARSRSHALAAQFVAYLISDAAQNVLHDAGFAPVN